VAFLSSEESPLSSLQRVRSYRLCYVKKKKRQPHTLFSHNLRYNTSFFAILTAVLLLVEMELKPHFITVSLLIMGGTAITVFTLFFQKFYFLIRGVSLSSTNSKTLPTSKSHHKPSSHKSANDDQELYKKIDEKEELVLTLRNELKKLRAELERYKKTIKKYKDESMSIECSSEEEKDHQ